MKKLIGSEYQTYLIDMLRFLTEFCKNNGIVFYMFYGSLIGTMRHQGFIPWDDDIDVVFPRPEYEKLISALGHTDGRYQIVSMHTNNLFTAPLAKLIDTKTKLIQNYGYRETVELGAYIDLFVYDGFPDDEKRRSEHMDRCIKLTKQWSHANHSFHYSGSSFIKDVARRAWYLPSVIKGTKCCLKEIDKNAKKYSFDDCHYVGSAAYVTYGSREIFEKTDLSFTEYGVFEGIQVPIPNGYDHILTHIYGDWRKLPPKEKQVTHHDFDCFLID